MTTEEERAEFNAVLDSIDGLTGKTIPLKTLRLLLEENEIVKALGKKLEDRGCIDVPNFLRVARANHVRLITKK